MRSPPPPATQQQHANSYGDPYASAPVHGGGSYGPGFGGFINDPTAQMGFQVGKSAVMAGQEYMEQNVRIQAHLWGITADDCLSSPATASLWPR